MTLAAIDRLVHHATILEMNVESYRRKVALDRRRGPGRPPVHATPNERVIDAGNQIRALLLIDCRHSRLTCVLRFGRIAPELAVGDGALGFWRAMNHKKLRRLYREEQPHFRPEGAPQCWFGPCGIARSLERLRGPRFLKRCRPAERFGISEPIARY